MLIIDSDNYQATGIETLFFPGGEPHAKLPIFKGDILFHLKARTWTDVGLGACVWDALQRQNLLNCELFIPYFPGARQDRSDGTAPLTEFLMHRLFCRFKYPVQVFDLHSPTHSTFSLDNISPIRLNEMPIYGDVVGVIAPDAGATERAATFRDRFYPGKVLVQCSKHRDPHSGQLSGFVCPKLPVIGRYIIVDDICDGGGTFNLLAEAFFKDKLGQYSCLSMYVSHGIFSKGLENIDPRIDTIITTDSWCQLPNGYAKGRLQVLPLLPQVLRCLNVSHYHE